MDGSDKLTAQFVHLAWGPYGRNHPRPYVRKLRLTSDARENPLSSETGETDGWCYARLQVVRGASPIGDGGSAQ